MIVTYKAAAFRELLRTTKAESDRTIGVVWLGEDADGNERCVTALACRMNDEGGDGDVLVAVAQRGPDALAELKLVSKL